MVVSEAGPVEAGDQDLTLICTLNEVIMGLTNIPSGQWMTTAGPVTSGDNIIITETVIDERTITVTLSFSSLHTSHAGQYMCQGTLESPARLDVITSTLATVSVHVRCKYIE